MLISQPLPDINLLAIALKHNGIDTCMPIVANISKCHIFGLVK